MSFRSELDITRQDLEKLFDIMKYPYTKRCIHQGTVNGFELKLYALETENFAYVEKWEPYVGGIMGYFFIDLSPQNLHDLQHWQVTPGREINLVDVGDVSNSRNTTDQG